MKTDLITQELKDEVLELHSQGISGRQIHEVHMTHTDLSLKNVQHIINGTCNINKLVDDQKYYEIEEEEDGKYVVFYKKRKDLDGEVYKDKFKISFDEIGRIWYEYSKHGANKSGQQIMIEFELKPEAWNLIKSRLGLYKDSHAIPNIILEDIEEKYGPQGVEEIIREVSHQSINDKYKNPFKNIYKKEELKQFKKALKISGLYEYRKQDFLEAIKDYKFDYKPIQFNIKKEFKEGMFGITDLHFGKNGTQEIVRRLKEVSTDIIQGEYTKAHIICGGDIFENMVVGGMHLGQEQGMELHGKQLYKFTIDKMLEFFADLYAHKVDVTFYGLTGNHDRSSKDKVTGGPNMAGEFFYHFIEDKIFSEFGYKFIDLHELKGSYEEWFSLDIMGYQVVGHHGTGPTSSKNTKEILWELGDNKKFNIVIFGDKHHFEGYDCSKNAIKLLMPGLAGSGKYDKALALSSCPGYIRIDDREGLPMNTTIRLR